MKLLATLNPEYASEAEADGYMRREAARAVVFDAEGNIELLGVAKLGYHKLPGGGVEAGEGAVDALMRECREEIGCTVEIIDALGEIIEYRKMFNLKQTSFCFLAKVVGAKGEPGFMPDEIAAGFEIQWVPFSVAKQLLNLDRPEAKEAVYYMIPREKIILEAAKAALTHKTGDSCSGGHCY